MDLKASTLAIRQRMQKRAPRSYYLFSAAANTAATVPADLRFRRSHAGELSVPLPPPYLRYRVAGSYDLAAFYSSGAESLAHFDGALRSSGTSFEDAASIFEFGVGCGRIARWLAPLAGDHQLHGSDIDEWAIRWCQRRLPFGSFIVNGELPPLAYEDDSFDLVYSHSVFTHLDQAHQRAWLEEIRRVLKPGGWAALTTHGEVSIGRLVRGFRRRDEALGDRVEAEIRDAGFFFDADSQWRGVFPDYYHNSYQTRAYTEREWARVMPIVSCAETAALGEQDIYVLRKQ